jgi:hypothetical protein
MASWGVPRERKPVNNMHQPNMGYGYVLHLQNGCLVEGLARKQTKGTPHNTSKIKWMDLDNTIKGAEPRLAERGHRTIAMKEEVNGQDRRQPVMTHSMERCTNSSNLPSEGRFSTETVGAKGGNSNAVNHSKA